MNFFKNIYQYWNKNLHVISFRCKCGFCQVDLLENAKECHCCKEVQGCKEALQDERVIDEIGSTPGCITLHPAFRAVCLEPWALRQLAGKFKTRIGRRYRQRDNEAVWVRCLYDLSLEVQLSSFFQKNIFWSPDIIGHHWIRSHLHREITLYSFFYKVIVHLRAIGRGIDLPTKIPMVNFL